MCDSQDRADAYEHVALSGGHPDNDEGLVPSLSTGAHTHINNNVMVHAFVSLQSLSKPGVRKVKSRLCQRCTVGALVIKKWSSILRAASKNLRACLDIHVATMASAKCHNMYMRMFWLEIFFKTQRVECTRAQIDVEELVYVVMLMYKRCPCAH
jgi:hypothetical protein